MPMLTTEKITPTVFELPVYLWVGEHQLCGTGGFPKALELGNNNFTGVIPKEIGQLKGLLSLNMSSNKFTGAIPPSICKLTNLQVLDLSGNHLTGVIPSALSNLHRLSQFNVSNNDLEGPIPTMGQFSTFSSSSFDGNPKLCGPVLELHCSSPKAMFTMEEHTDDNIKSIFVVVFCAFFGVGVLYDQMVLSRYFG